MWTHIVQRMRSICLTPTPLVGKNIILLMYPPNQFLSSSLILTSPKSSPALLIPSSFPPQPSSCPPQPSSCPPQPSSCPPQPSSCPHQPYSFPSHPSSLPPLPSSHVKEGIFWLVYRGLI